MTEDEQEAIVNDWVMCAMTGDPQATVANLLRVLRNDSEIDELRDHLAGFHFAKEGLTERELEILAIAEDLLRILDGEVTA